MTSKEAFEHLETLDLDAMELDAPNWGWYYDHKNKTKAELVREDLAIIGKDLETLEQYKNIEEELGVDLITLFKALKQSYIYALFGNSIFKIQIEGINYNTGYLILYDEDNHSIFEWGEINAYGKTWALAREELENDK